MRMLFKTTLSAVIILLTFSCKKEPISKQQSSTSISNAGAGACYKPWIGQYANGIIPNDTINQNHFIADGVAQMPPPSPRKNFGNSYFTGIYYNIPHCHLVNGGNVIYEARVKNPSQYGYDVALQIQGTKNFFEVNFIGVPQGQQYDHITIGGYSVYNLPELIHYFEDFETVSVKLSDHTIKIYLGETLIKSVDYDVANKLGNIKFIGCGFKGTGTIDWVKLYNRGTGALLMQENFDIDGQSDVMWYD